MSGVERGRVTGAADDNGTPIMVGDIVRFQFKRDMSEPDVGYYDTDGTLFEACGEVRMSPYRGAYMVRQGRVYRLRRNQRVKVVNGGWDRSALDEPEMQVEI